jgi:hypothetical protein
MPTQIAGYTVANIQEVEAGSRAARVVLRPDDPGALGWYRGSWVSGTMVAALAANSPIFQWRYGGTPNLIAIRKIEFSSGNLAAFTAGLCLFNLFKSTAWSANGTGGSQLFPGTGNKLRTSFPSSLMSAANNCDIRVATTAALTAGTKTNDTQPIGALASSEIATAGTPLTPGKQNLLELRGWEYPFLLAQNEGFEVQATVPASGTWNFELTVLWAELASY